MRKRGERSTTTEVKKPHKNGALQKGKDSCVVSNPKAAKDPSPVLKALGYLVRTMLLDLPIITLFTFLVATYLFQQVMHEYLEPQFALLQRKKPRDYTYYRRACTHRDISTNNTLDLVVTDTQDAVEKTLTHGASIYPHLLSNETARELREYILEQNKIRKTLHLAHKPENRSSYGFTPNGHPILRKSLNELLTNKRFRSSIEAIAGKDPAIVEFSHITSTYGAVDQAFHADVGQAFSAAAYARNGVPSYSLFITLQDTTKEMGATGICPGTHLCRIGAALSCREGGIQVFEGSEAWPTGWGFLYNSAMMHRGTAHTDPNEPARVLLLLTFLSRPRYGRNTLETRYISDHYFNRWLSWGHTLSDFAEPAKHMSQPWQTLRTLGIYKAPGRAWGWDFVSVLLLYIANNDGDGQAVEGKLEQSIEQAGLKRLPSFLRVDVPAESKGEVAKDWINYFDRLLEKWQGALLMVYLGSFSFYILMLVLVDGRSAIKHGIGRLVLCHAVILVTAWLLLRRASTSTWAKNIKSGRLYLTSMESRGPKLPSTLPLLSDILTPNDYQSEYLDSFNRILDYGHAGNKQWNDILKGYSVGYNKLESKMQEQLSSNVVLWARQQQSRILTKNHLNEWAELDEERARRFAHKELMKASNPFIEHAIRWTEFLLSETKYGYWRDTSMHIGAIPSLLRNLQGKLLRSRPTSSNETKFSIVPAIDYVNLVVGSPLSVKSSLHVRPKGLALFVSSLSEGDRIPPVPPIVEPYPGAWFQVGDMVEARLAEQTSEQKPGVWDRDGDVVKGVYAEQTIEWVRGMITATNPRSMRWDVVYSNGRSDEHLCQRCVRPFTPFVVGETVRFSDGENRQTSTDARVIGIDEINDLYDIELENGTVRKVPITRLHRSKTDKYIYKKGSHAHVGDGPKAKTVLVLRVNGNETFTVGASDGRTGVVPVQALRPHMTWYEEYIS